jgi:hypothetical protein
MITSATAAIADVLDCGHPATPDPTGIGTGRAIDPHTDTTSCYPCSDEHERDAMTRANTFVAYVSTHGDALTTWPGGHLATIDPADTRQTGRRTCTPSGGIWTRYVWHATDVDGGRWTGVNGGPGLVFVKFYDRLDLSRARLDDVLTVPANRTRALDVAQDRHLPRQALTRATTREGFWVYVFQLRADVQLGTVTLAGAQPGPENVITLPVRQLDHYATPGMPLSEIAGLLTAVAEDYPPTTLTAVLADSFTKVLDLWADARRNDRPTIDIRDLDRAITSEFGPAVRAWRTGDAFPRPRLADTAWPEPVPR